MNIDAPAITEKSLEHGSAENHQRVAEQRPRVARPIQGRIDPSLDQPGKRHAGKIRGDQRKNAQDEKMTVAVNEKLDPVVVA